MDEMESDEALRFYQFLNYLDGGSFGTGTYKRVMAFSVDILLRLFNLLPLKHFEVCKFIDNK